MHQGMGFATAAMAVSLLLPFATGCRVEGHKNGKDGVSIDTPLGGLNVKGDPAAVLSKVGLPAYPGAQPLAEDGDDEHSADVNLSFGSFKVQVLATGLQTTDAPAQVEAFYRKALAQYSDVIACHDQQPIGSPTRTGMGLTCDDDKTRQDGARGHERQQGRHRAEGGFAVAAARRGSDETQRDNAGRVDFAGAAAWRQLALDSLRDYGPAAVCRG